jgi:hypothetical protein
MELSITEQRDKMSLCIRDGDLDALIKVRDSFNKELKVMDKWFDKYLEMMDRKMKPEEPNTPEWKLYHRKSEEYSDLKILIKTADVYVSKLRSAETV